MCANWGQIMLRQPNGQVSILHITVYTTTTTLGRDVESYMQGGLQDMESRREMVVPRKVNEMGFSWALRTMKEENKERKKRSKFGEKKGAIV